MADKKVTDLTAATSIEDSDLFHMIDDVTGTPTNKKITIKHVFANVPANTTISGSHFVANTANVRFAVSDTPANSTMQCLAGQIKWDASYIYVATSNNVWKRVALSSF